MTESNSPEFWGIVGDGAPAGAWDFGYTQLMLTDAAIKRLQPKPAAYRVFEGGEVPGFGVKVEVSGKKSWFLRFQWAGKRRYLLLGHYPHIGTAAARDKARAALAFTSGKRRGLLAFLP